MAKITAIMVAQIIIKESKEKNLFLNNTKLQKLLYIVYGIYLNVNRNILFIETPLYLPYGPVFDTVYKEYKNRDVTEEVNYERELYENSKFMEALNATLDFFGAYGAQVLSEWSHRSGSAWDKIHQSNEDSWGVPLQLLDIVEEFDQIVSKTEKVN